jgi:hypothetical protein
LFEHHPELSLFEADGAVLGVAHIVRSPDATLELFNVAVVPVDLDSAVSRSLLHEFEVGAHKVEPLAIFVALIRVVPGIPVLVDCPVLWVLHPPRFFTHLFPELDVLEVLSAVVHFDITVFIE